MSSTSLTGNGRQQRNEGTPSLDGVSGPAVPAPPETEPKPTTPTKPAPPREKPDSEPSHVPIKPSPKRETTPEGPPGGVPNCRREG